MNDGDFDSYTTGEIFDSTGMFHWIQERHFKECMLDKDKKHNFFGHVIVCVFADPDSPLIGLRNFVLPLRASNYNYEELKAIIFIGNEEFLSKEWKTISNFPKVYVLSVSNMTEQIKNKKSRNYCICFKMKMTI
jgi:potassium large conductance calcium-activated channel subfamily M alpha member 1